MMTKPRIRPMHNEWRPWFAWYPALTATEPGGDEARWVWLRRIMIRCATGNALICIDCGCDIECWMPNP